MNNFIQNIAVLLTRNELICNKLPIIIKETGQNTIGINWKINLAAK